MHSDSEEYISFRTTFDSYKCKVLSFGLCNGPDTYQHYMNEVLLDYLNVFCTAYLDDILIYSEDPLERKTHIKLMLERLIQTRLQMNIKKSEFHIIHTKYLDFVMIIEDVEIDSEKVECLKNGRYPKTVRDIGGYLDFTEFYRKFVRDYECIARPLNNLIKNNVVFHFDDDYKEIFDIIYTAILSPKVIRYFVFKLSIMIETDFSDVIISGILFQLHDDGKWHPVAFFTKTMKSIQYNYEIHNKKLFAIVKAFQEWRTELIKYQDIQIFSDHKALEYFMTIKHLISGQVQWTEILSQYHFRIMYHIGKSNEKTDILSGRDQEYMIQSLFIKDNRIHILFTSDRLDDIILQNMIINPISAIESIIVVSLFAEESLLLINELLINNKNSFETKRKELYTGYIIKNNLLLYNEHLIVRKRSELATRLIGEVYIQVSSIYSDGQKTYKLLKSRYVENLACG